MPFQFVDMAIRRKSIDKFFQRQPVDDDKGQIVASALPTMSRYWEQLQAFIAFPGNKFFSFLDAEVPSS